MIICLIVIAVGVILGTRLINRGKTARGEMAVYVDGQLYQTLSIRPGEDLTVSQEDGSVNVIHMVEGGFQMAYATCRDQLCVHQGTVTAENWKTRELGPRVICLPNRVIVTLVVDDADPEAPDI